MYRAALNTVGRNRVMRFTHRLLSFGVVGAVVLLGVLSVTRSGGSRDAGPVGEQGTTTAVPETAVRETAVPETAEPAAAITTTTISQVAASALDPSLAPVCGPVEGTVPGGAGCRIIAYYGNPQSKKMGVLGATPKADMLAKLAAKTQTWQTADPATPTKCALELIAVFAQAEPGQKNLHRARMSASKIDEVLRWAREAKCLLILDVQVGWSSVADEVPFLAPWLKEPDVHLGLDPEWDMPVGVIPGQKVGRMSAADVQFGIDFVSDVVKANNLPPKLVVVHRFQDFMVTNPELIRPTPEIRLVVNADGFGPPEAKFVTFRIAQVGMPTALTGFKLFLKNDKPILQPADVLPLVPQPVFINYQ